jgi:endoglucanase
VPGKNRIILKLNKGIASMVNKLTTIPTICALLICTAVSLYAETAVERHGQLKTSGPYILNKNNEIVQLRGMSFYWSKWEGPQFYTADIVNQLVDSWKCTVVRVAYAEGSEGWSSCQTVIDAAINKGIYVIIDWHSHNAHEQESSAIAFFREQARKYKDTPNVIFEPFNEPKWAGGAEADVGDLDNAKKTWTAIKPYLKNVTKAIRAEGAQNLVILGTPYYSQFVNVAGSEPVLDDGNKPFTNLAYSFHFYAASHGSYSYYMKQSGGTSMVPGYLDGGLGKKVPIFVTEWGTTHSDGGKGSNNYVDAENTNWWFQNYVDKNHLSHCNWSVNNSNDASSAFAGGSGPSNPSASGKVAKKYITVSTVDHWKLPSEEGKHGDSGDSTFAMPGTHPAIGYNLYWGANFSDDRVPFLLRDDTSGARTSKNTAIYVPGNIGSDEWVEYNIKSSKASSYILFRYLAIKGTGAINILLDQSSIGTISFTATPGDSTWGFKVVPAAVTSGDHKLKFELASVSGEGYYFSWFELTDNPDIPMIAIPFSDKIKKSISIISMSNKRIALCLPEFYPFQSYTLVGIDGRTVISAHLLKSTKKITINTLSSGTYFIKFLGKEFSMTQKVVLSCK